MKSAINKDLSTTQIYAKVRQEHLRTVVGEAYWPCSTPEFAAASHKRVTHDDEDASDSQKLLKPAD
jgi:hypothetical protein